MKIKFIIRFALALVMAASIFAGCGTSPGAGQVTVNPGIYYTNTAYPWAVNLPPPVAPPEEGAEYLERITVLLDNNKPSTLDLGSRASSSNATRWMTMLFLDRLVELNSHTGVYEPQLATSWQSSDWRTITLDLRDDVYFHNGDHFTAADVVYTIERAWNSPGTLSSEKWGLVESTRIINDYKIELRLGSPNVDFIFELTQTNSGILNQNAIEADPETGPWVGSGPWIVSNFVLNDSATFVRNENFWGDVPATKELTLRFVEEQSAQLMMLENGEVQVACGINPNDYPYLESDPRFVTYGIATHNVTYLAFNMQVPIMEDINFRLAVAHALNMDDIVLSARNGYGLIPDHGSFWGHGTEFLNDSIHRLPYDPGLAREYLARSGYDGERLEITAAFTTFINTAQVIQQNLAAVGINARIFETDGLGIMSLASFSNNQSQMVCFTGAWSLPASSVNIYLYPGSVNNRASYVNDTVTELLDRALTTFAPVAREALYWQVQEIVAHDLPYLNLYHVVFIVGALQGVEGVNLYGDGVFDFRQVRMRL